MAEEDGKELEIDKATPQLPDELLIEIFLRLPPRSLFLFRSVSKHWLALIENPNFISSHVNRPIPNRNRNPLLIVRTVESEPESHHYRKFVLTLLSDDKTLAYSDDVALDLVSPSMASRGLCHGEDRLHLLNPSNGLFCITDTADVVVFNPATRQARQLPRSPLSRRSKNWYRSNAVGFFDRVEFGFDPVSNDYKVVRFHFKEELDKYYTNVVDGADDYNGYGDDSDSDGIEYDIILRNIMKNLQASHNLVANDDKDDDDDDDDDDHDHDDDNDNDDDDYGEIDSYDDVDSDDDYDFRDHHIKVEIFSLKTNCWREVDSVLPASYPSRIHSHSVYLNGAFHWLAGGSDEEIGSVIAFDLDKEAFKHFRLPEYYNKHNEEIQLYLSVRDECLSLIVHWEWDYLELDVEFEIWVMRRYGKYKSWRKLTTISFDVGIDRPLSFGGKRELLAVHDDKRLVSFDLKTKEVKEFGNLVDKRSAHAFRYKESLISLY